MKSHANTRQRSLWKYVVRRLKQLLRNPMTFKWLLWGLRMSEEIRRWFDNGR